MSAMDLDQPGAGWASGPQFDPDLLRLYYARLFPYDQWCKWMAYNSDEPGTGSQLARRELSLTLADDVYIRYQCFTSAKEMKSLMTKRQPHKIDIGAVFNCVPRDHLSVKNFRPESRELVFDIDLSDYDDVRTCCQGATVCKKCWQYMTCAVKVCESALREDFGFEHIVWIYSGRRGVHCWVCDETARSRRPVVWRRLHAIFMNRLQERRSWVVSFWILRLFGPRCSAQARELTNDARLAIIKYFSVVSGNENQAKKTQLSSPLHPSLERAYRLLEPLFVEHVIGSEGQGLLSSPERWETLLKTLPEEIGGQISKHWNKNGSDTSPLEKWEALKGLCVSEKPNQAKKQKRATVPELWKYETVFSQCYPRLDENVSKHRNHLLKSPFAAHPKTGRVCVPFDARQVASFDPTTVVTLRQLSYELDQYSGDDVPDLEKTSLAHSVRFFERDFLHPMMKSWARSRRDDAEYAAALKGDF